MENKKWRPSEEELIEIFKQQGFDPKYQTKFVEYYNYCFDDMYPDYKDWEDSDWEEGDSLHNSALWVTNHFFEKYLEVIAKGHGEEWAHFLAHTLEDGDRAIEVAYNEMLKNSEDLAYKELQIHIASLGLDKYFDKYFTRLFNSEFFHANMLESAKEYSEIIKGELSKGKQEIYADKYASLMSGGFYDKIYCEDYATAFENSIFEGKDEQYADIYAEQYASNLIDIKARHSDPDEASIDFAIERAKSYMKAWEYNKQSPVRDFENFASIYENAHLNTYFADDGRPNLSTVEIDKLVLKMALERLNK